MCVGVFYTITFTLRRFKLNTKLGCAVEEGLGGWDWMQERGVSREGERGPE